MRRDASVCRHEVVRKEIREIGRAHPIRDVSLCNGSCFRRGDGLLSHKNLPDVWTGESKMKCPVCSVELRLAERQGVEIDYCPQCRGVWLDRGELDKIIDKSAREYELPRESDYRSPRRSHEDEHERYYGKKKKSFLRDIFDFD